MKKVDRIEVCLNFLDEDYHIGTLFNTSGRGEHVSFKYSDEWLSSNRYFAIQPDIDGAGMHFPTDGRPLISCFMDSGPDRWGRNLLQKAIKSGLRDNENINKKTNISELTYILMVQDTLRHGAIRYRNSETDEYFSSPSEGVPKLLQLRSLYASSCRVSEEDFRVEDVKNLLAPGSSLGGARPKAGIIDKKKLYIAKFSKPGDEWNVPAWEFVNLTIAKNAGLNVPEFRLEKIAIGGKDVHALLLRRFDRTDKGGRIPFISALSMMNLEERERRGYFDIAAVIEEHGYSTDLQELWARMVLNILISNVDDHLRNHGFLRDKHGWRLSPLYDLESSPEAIAPSKVWCTGIYNGDDRRSTIDDAIEAAKLFRLSQKEAIEKMSALVESVSNYKKIAASVGISRKEIELMSSAYAAN